MISHHELFMNLAIEEAEQAASEGEVPVGAVAILGDEVIARDHNRREGLKDPTAHAEILTLRETARRLGRWRLTGIRLYVTLEPCVLCAGAIVLSRVSSLIFGCRDSKGGACGSLYSIVQDQRLNHRVDVVEGIRADACAERLKTFFGALRQKGSLLPIA
jgi:tRNA(adenine34) deaminase